MSHYLLAAHADQLPPPALPIPAPMPVPRPSHPGMPATGDRRRPGRLENASPELIALMRKPTRAARMRVALYDAPGFILTPDRRSTVSARGLARMAVALVACSAACAAAFKTMLVVWG